MSLFVAPALAGRHRRASFRSFVCPFVRSSVRTFVRPSIRQHLTWVSCERNSSYSFAPIVLKLCMCFPHGMRMCMWIGHNCWINFCHFFDIVNLVIFHPDYIDRGSFVCPFVRSSVRTFVRPSIRQHLTWVSCERNSSYSFAPIVLKLCMCFPHGMRMCMWIGHNCWINFCHFFDIVNLVIFHPDYIDRGYIF